MRRTTLALLLILLWSCESPETQTLRKYRPEIERVLTGAQIGTYAYESQNTSPNCIRATYDSLRALAQSEDSFATATMLMTPEEIDTIATTDPFVFYDQYLKKADDAPKTFTIVNSFVKGGFVFVNCTQDNSESEILPIQMTTVAFEIVDSKLYYYNPWTLATSTALVQALEAQTTEPK